MGNSLVQFMKLAVAALILFGLIIGITYTTLENLNSEHHEKLKKYQTQTK
ncbi:hypothetical protein ACFVAD_18775 [Sutcliffiella sp. NPDC057660]